MGKAGRAACILTPMLLTLASFICLLLVELGGYSKGNDTLNGFNFFTADLTNLTIPSSTSSSSELATAIQNAKSSGALADVYQIHLWNYCSSNSSSDGEIDYCSKRKTGFVFDPTAVWRFNTADSTATATTTGDNAVESTISSVKNTLSAYEDDLLGESGKKALDAYRTVAKWMFISYQVSFWTTLATIAVGLLAICSRWGSLLTWIIALVSAVFTFASVLTSTILFSILVSALNKVLDEYKIHLTTTRSTLIVCWLAVLFSFGALFFWLCSICCCSGRSNPHHKSNKGGLWNAEPKGQGYADFGGRGRGLQVEKTGSGYERVASPYVGGHHHDDQVPLTDYAQPIGGYGRPQQGQTVGLEPYRHS